MVPRQSNKHLETDNRRQSAALRATSLEKIIEDVDALELNGSRVVPFAHDLFGRIWLVACDEEDPAAGGAVVLVPVQERYTDPDDPIEHRATTFGSFLRDLDVASGTA